MPTNNDTTISRRSVLKTGALTAGGLALGISLAATPAAAAGEFCPRSPGFWKTHPNDWPEGTEGGLNIGGQLYTKEEALEILNTPARGNKWVILARSTIAAKLNYYINSPCPEVTEILPQQLTLTCPGNPVECWLRDNVDSRSWNGAEEYYEILDDYNNGLLCDDPCVEYESGPATPR